MHTYARSFKAGLLCLALMVVFSFEGKAQGSGWQLGTPELLTTPTEFGWMQPRFGPDGNQLAITSERYAGIWVVDVGDRSVRQLTDAPAAGFQMAWSDDGQALLARPAQFDGPRRYNTVTLFDVATGIAEDLTAPRTMMPALPRWAPDQASVVLYNQGQLEVLATTRAAKGGGAAAASPVAVATEKGLGVASLIDPTVVAVPELIGRRVINLVTSPDGERVAFEVMGGNLYTMRTDGTDLVDLGPGHRPRWSPWSTWLVFMRTEDDGHDYTASDLWAVQADGEQLQRLTSTPDVLEMNPDWSPDGEWLAFDAGGAVYRAYLTKGM